jgi:hypothetical protein
MSVPRSVADVLRNHVTLEVESIDRMYLNVYQPKLQTEKQAACFFRFHRGQPVASSALMGVMTKAFLRQVDAFVERHGIPVVQFRKGQRKDDVAAEYRAKLPGGEGVLFLGKAQEKVTIFRTERRTDQSGRKYPWIVKSATPVNQIAASYCLLCHARRFATTLLFCAVPPTEFYCFGRGFGQVNPVGRCLAPSRDRSRSRRSRRNSSASAQMIHCRWAGARRA